MKQRHTPRPEWPRTTIRCCADNILALLPLETVASHTSRGVVRAVAQVLLARRIQRHPISYRSRPTLYGFTMSGNTKDFIQRCIYVFGCWEPNLSRYFEGNLRPGDIVVDLGANVGYFSLLASSLVGNSGRVFAVEPIPEFAEALQSDAESNNFDNIHVFRVAASDHDGFVTLYRSAASNLGATSTQTSGDATDAVTRPCARVESLIPTELWGQIRLVKIDVEGDELRALRGMHKLLTSLPVGATVMTEVTPEGLTTRSESTDDLLSLMNNLGYEAMYLPNKYGLRHYTFDAPADPSPLIGRPATQTDILFVRRSQP